MVTLLTTTMHRLRLVRAHTIAQAAIITSFIGFVVGLLDFFTDVFNVRAGDKKVSLLW
jgi:amino acid permease